MHLYTKTIAAMDYLLYEAEDFASNESYLRYYFRLNDSDIAFWEDWICRHPERLDMIMNADHLISSLSLQLPENEFQQEYERMKAAICLGSDTVDDSLPTLQRQSSPIRHRPGGRRSLLLWLAAASTAAVLFFLYFNLFPVPHFRHTSLPFSAIGQLHEKTNATAVAQRVQLEDGSVIILQPGGKLSYPPHFLSDRREVWLEGEAFFTVSKNPQSPFYVYCDNFVTHVLGTSFTIRTDKQKQQIEVAVHTGKVEVYKRPESVVRRDPAEKSNGVILTPNQRVIYREDKQQFETSLVAEPQPLVPETGRVGPISGSSANLVFNNASLAVILQSLQKIYAIDIEVENDNINNCHFSGDVSDMDLYARLDVVCRSINASYEIVGTKILVRGKGCN